MARASWSRTAPSATPSTTDRHARAGRPHGHRGGARCQARQLAAERPQRQDRARAHRAGCRLRREPCTTARQPSRCPKFRGSHADEAHALDLPSSSPRLPAAGWARSAGARLRAPRCLGGAVHICVTFAAPLVGPGNAFQQLRASLPLNQMVVLPPPASGKQILPYLPPDMLYAMCRYELTGGPVSRDRRRVRPGLGVVAAHAAGRQLLRAAGAAAAPRRGVVPAGAERRCRATLSGAPAPPTHRLPHPAGGTDRGARAHHGPGLAGAETDAVLRRSSCTQVKR